MSGPPRSPTGWQLGREFVVFWIGYQAVLAIAILVPGRGSLIVAPLLALAFTLRVLLRFGHPDQRRRRAALRLRLPAPPVWIWTLAAAPVLLAMSWALARLYQGIVPLPAEAWDQLGGLTETANGRRLAALLAVGVAPVVEEFFFRGALQRPLERRWGARRAIGVTALVFALAHPAPWLYPLLFFLGVAFGAVVVVSRSIWPAVLLHAANNGLALAGLDAGEQPTPEPTFWQPGFTPAEAREMAAAFALLVLGIPAAHAVLRGMRRAASQHWPGRFSGELPT